MYGKLEGKGVDNMQVKTFINAAFSKFNCYAILKINGQLEISADLCHFRKCIKAKDPRFSAKVENYMISVIQGCPQLIIYATNK